MLLHFKEMFCFQWCSKDRFFFAKRNAFVCFFKLLVRIIVIFMKKKTKNNLVF